MHKGSSWAWESAQVTSDQLPSAPTATTRITRTHALPTATTGIAGSLAASSSVQARGSMVASMDAQDTGDMETGVTDATGDIMMAAASTDMARLEAGSITAMATTASTAAIITAEAASTVVATSTVAVADSTAVVAATVAVTGKFQS